MTTERYIPGFNEGRKPFESAGFQPEPRGQSYPEHYPHWPTADSPVGSSKPGDTLGEPLSVRQVARLLGCSDWTIRHGYLPRGLPHLRSGPLGKLVFFEKQVIRWVLEQQRKGGI